MLTARWRDSDGESLEHCAPEARLAGTIDVDITATPFTNTLPIRYRFEALEGGFTRDLDVDEHGLVVHYPGLFEPVG